MNVISTFSGCGGSSLGYKQAGCKVLACVEWDDHAVECYRLNHPDTRIFHGDIHKITGAMLLDAVGLGVGELDILDGSPPCQGFSTAGKRVIDDPRNSLFQQQIRLIREIQPRHVVIENVAGLVKGKMKRVAGEIVSALKDSGYTVVAGVLEAQYFGVGQRRPRTFFIGSRVGTPTLPCPKTRPTTARAALAGIVPDGMAPLTPAMRRIGARMTPGGTGALATGTQGYFSGKMLHPDRPSFTVTKTYPFGGLWHWDRRQISIREALVLTGFPPDYKLTGGFSQKWARIGNSVAPPMTQAIAEMLLRMDCR